MSHLSTALPLAQSSSTNLGFLSWDAKEHIALSSAASPEPLSKPSSEFIRPSYESRFTESTSGAHSRCARQPHTSADCHYYEEDEDEDEDEEVDRPRRTRSPHSTYGAHRSSFSLRLSQALYLSSTTTTPPPPVPPFPSDLFFHQHPEAVLGLPRKYTPSPSPVVGEFDPNGDEFVRRSTKRTVAAGLKKQLKRMFSRRRRNGSVAGGVLI